MGPVQDKVVGARFPKHEAVLHLDQKVGDRPVRIDLKSAALFTNRALRTRLPQHSGSAVNAASTSALPGEAIDAAYGAAKAGIPLTTRPDRAVHHVYVRRVLRTDIIQSEEIVKLYTFLVSADLSALHGQILVADGGMMAHAAFRSDRTEDDALDQINPVNI